MITTCLAFLVIFVSSSDGLQPTSRWPQDLLDTDLLIAEG